MNRQQLYELLRLDPHQISKKVEFWALYATSLYERLFMKIFDPKLVTAAYNYAKNNMKLSGKGREALEFFYHLRLDELDNPDFWDMVGNKKMTENMKAKLVKESINEYNNAFGPLAGSGNDYGDERSLATEVSELETLIWNSNNRPAQREWEQYSEGVLYPDNSDFPDNDDMYDEDEDENQWGGENETPEAFWDDLSDHELTEAIMVAYTIISKYKLNKSLKEAFESTGQTVADFNRLGDALQKNGIPCKIIMDAKGGIDILCGFDYPDSLSNRVWDIMDEVGVKADISADISGPPPVESRRINGGPREYEREYDNEDDYDY